MTSIAALSVQSTIHPAAAKAAAPVVVTPADVRPAEAVKAAKPSAPAVPLVAQGTLAALVLAQAQQGGAHIDPQPDHGQDDAHGHRPSPQPVPAPTPDPTPAPPVVQPPGVQPPVTPPVVLAPAPAIDLAEAARAVAGVERALAEGRIAEAERSALAAAAAERRAAVTVAQGRAALAILNLMQADMADFRAHAPGRYDSPARRV